MKNLLLIPDSLKSSFKKNFDGKIKGYKVCFYPPQNVLRKIITACPLYEPDRIIAVGSEKEYDWNKQVAKKFSFDSEDVEAITLEYEEVTLKRFNKKTVEKIIELL